LHHQAGQVKLLATSELDSQTQACERASQRHPNLVTLEHFTESSILHELRERYAQQDICG
jgi:hypothetical protein